MGAERGGVSVRERLPRDLAWVVAAAGLVLTVTTASRYGAGWDAHAYWVAWEGGRLYTVAPTGVDAYLYSPVFAQVTRPLTLLPWPVAAAVFLGAGAIGTAWLLAPLGVRNALPLWLAASVEYVSGNVFWLLALAVVLAGARPPARAAWWSVAALTKVTPCLGPVWHLARGQWTRLAVAVAAPLVVAGLSWLVTPDLWSQWLQFLVTHVGRSTGSVGAELTPPLVLRLPAAMALVVWGARTDRVWTLPVAMLVATPVLGVASLTLLAALPRLRAQGERSAYLVRARMRTRDAG